MQTIPLRIVAAAWLLGLCAPPASADAWHQFSSEDGFWHHYSGWIFPAKVGGFALVRSPYQLDGNDDVGAQYEMVVNGVRRTAEVTVYYPNSADAGARLDTARAKIQDAAKTGTSVTLKSEARLVILQRPEIVGVSLSYAVKDEAGESRLGLNFFQASNWVVTIRTGRQATDTEGDKALEAFVQEQRWDTLGTDSGRYHLGRSMPPRQ